MMQLLDMEMPDPLSLYCILYEMTNMTAWILEGYHGVDTKVLEGLEDLAVENIKNNVAMQGILAKK